MLSSANMLFLFLILSMTFVLFNKTEYISEWYQIEEISDMV